MISYQMVPSRTDMTLDTPNSFSSQNYRKLGWTQSNDLEQGSSFADGQHKKITESEVRENSEANNLTFMFSNYGAGEDSWEPLGLQGD